MLGLVFKHQDFDIKSQKICKQKSGRVTATSSAPAFPSSCAAAAAAAAAVRGRGDVDGIASIGVETHHLQ